MTPALTAQAQRRLALTGILEHVIASLELTATQRADVEKTYLEVGEYLSKVLGLAQHLGVIFAQGSMRLATVIRPLRDITDCFDLDVVFHILLLCTSRSPESVRDAVGEHLRAKYNGAVKPLAKGWRLDFSRERDYYLDIIPAMNSTNGGNVIAITDGNRWKDSNPRDYATWFEGIAARMPRFEGETMLKEGMRVFNSARIEPLPEHTPLKSPLQRIVQISKRHRDYYFNKKTQQSGLITSSIVVTTLLSKAYDRLVNARVYESGYDLLDACVADMPNHLETWVDNASKVHYRLINPSLPSENLIEKWVDQRYAQAFHAWHKDYVLFLQTLVSAEGSQRRLLSEALGERAVNSAFAKQADTFNFAKKEGILTIGPSVALSFGTGPTVSPKHVIHGAA